MISQGTFRSLGRLVASTDCCCHIGPFTGYALHVKLVDIHSEVPSSNRILSLQPVQSLASRIAGLEAHLHRPLRLPACDRLPAVERVAPSPFHVSPLSHTAESQKPAAGKLDSDTSEQSR